MIININCEVALTDGATITGLQTPSQADEAVPKSYVDDQLGYRLSDIQSMNTQSAVKMQVLRHGCNMYIKIYQTDSVLWDHVSATSSVNSEFLSSNSALAMVYNYITEHRRATDPIPEELYLNGIYPAYVNGNQATISMVNINLLVLYQTLNTQVVIYNPDGYQFMNNIEYVIIPVGPTSFWNY